MFDKIDDLIELIDGLDVGKVKDVVSDLWEDREKIIDSANFVWDHKDEIANLVSKLPELLESTGKTMDAAGSSAVKAAGLLTGEGDGASVGSLAAGAAGALTRAQEQVESAASLLARIGDDVDKLKVPTVEPKFTEVMGFDLVSGIEFGELSLIDEAADKLKDGSGTMTELGKDLANVAEQLRTLGEKVTDAGKDLDEVGSKLSDSGQTLAGISAWGS